MNPKGIYTIIPNTAKQMGGEEVDRQTQTGEREEAGKTKQSQKRWSGQPSP